MINIAFDLVTGLAKLTAATVIKQGFDVPVQVVFSVAPGSVSEIMLALGPDQSVPAVLAYTDVFTQANATTWTATLDASDTRLAAFMASKGPTAVDAELTAVIDGVRQVAPNMSIIVQPPIVTGPTSSDGGPIYLTSAQTAATYAPKASPAFTGIPTAPTAAGGTNTTQIATTAFVHAAIVGVVNAAPGALDTLKELADALGDDANFATTVTTALATKLVKSLNLSDLPSASAARTNLGLGSAAVVNLDSTHRFVTDAQMTGWNAVGGAVFTTGNQSISGTKNFTGGVQISGAPLGGAATLDAGGSANQVVQLDGSGKLPAVDGSQLTNLPSVILPATSSLLKGDGAGGAAAATAGSDFSLTHAQALSASGITPIADGTYAISTSLGGSATIQGGCITAWNPAS